jgi:cardiolipin synthase
MIFLEISINPYYLKIFGFIYFLIIIYTVYRILVKTYSTPKTLAYLILVFFAPLIGIVIFYAMGSDLRHSKLTQMRFHEMREISKPFIRIHKNNTPKLLNEYRDDLKQYKKLVKFLYNQGKENLNFNDYKLLRNGEEKFPDVLKELKKARSFIHIEYYAWENDVRGNQIKDILIKKAKEGIVVRVIYDAYASKGIIKNVVKELKNGSVEVYPIIKIKFKRLASRINHRDHRKIIIIDGIVGYVGGINISDRYDNSVDTGLYWRDTHIKITGETVLNLQRHFIVNWNICQPVKLTYSDELFPEVHESNTKNKKELAQVVAGGPIYHIPNIMLTYLKIFTLAEEKLYITNPYFIPNSSILNAIKQAAISGVDVRIIVPKKSDSALVGAASRFYFKELLEVGVKIYLYKKGFVHAKTVVADSYLSVVGTANMDIRSFDLNFEIMSVIYGNNFAKELEDDFLEDLEHCERMKYEDWIKQGKIKELSYAVARLISSLL